MGFGGVLWLQYESLGLRLRVWGRVMAYGFSVSFMNSHYGPCRWIPGLHGSFPKLGVPF